MEDEEKRFNNKINVRKKILFYVWMCVCLCVCAKGKNSRADFKKVLPFLPFNFS